MSEYTIKYMRPLGDYDQKYGQKYWGKVEEADMDVSFNLMNPKDFEEGDKITYGEKLIRETKAGKEYMQLRKVTLDGQTGLPVERVTPVSGGKTSDDYEPGTNARWAIGMAYRGHLQLAGGLPASDDSDSWQDIYANATRLVQMFSKVKSMSSGEGANLDDVAPTPSQQAPEEEPDTTGLSGLDKARATAKKLKDSSAKSKPAPTMTAEQAEAFLEQLREEEESNN